MAYTWARRNELALEKIARSMGLEGLSPEDLAAQILDGLGGVTPATAVRKRNAEAKAKKGGYTWARRNELARKRGFRSTKGLSAAGARRNASAAEKGYKSASEMTRLRSTGRALPTDVVGQQISGRRQVDRVGGRTIVETTSGGRGWGVIASQLRKAGDALVTARIVWADAKGGEHETPLWGHGQGARAILRGSGGDLPGYVLGQLVPVLTNNYRFDSVPVRIAFAQFTIGHAWPARRAA